MKNLQHKLPQTIPQTSRFGRLRRFFNLRDAWKVQKGIWRDSKAAYISSLRSERDELRAGFRELFTRPVASGVVLAITLAIISTTINMSSYYNRIDRRDLYYLARIAKTLPVLPISKTIVVPPVYAAPGTTMDEANERTERTLALLDAVRYDGTRTWGDFVRASRVSVTARGEDFCNNPEYLLIPSEQAPLSATICPPHTDPKHKEPDLLNATVLVITSARSHLTGHSLLNSPPENYGLFYPGQVREMLPLAFARMFVEDYRNSPRGLSKCVGEAVLDDPRGLVHDGAVAIRAGERGETILETTFFVTLRRMWRAIQDHF